MPKVANYLSLGAITLEKESELPLHRQLYSALRNHILNGRLRPGMRLPSTRALASDLSVSRNTVTEAFNQLLAEGYLETRVGSGTRVSRTLPEETLQVGVAETEAEKRIEVKRKPRLSRRGSAIAELPYEWEAFRPKPFDSALPAMEAFPNKQWEKLLVTNWRKLSTGGLGYQSGLGYAPLREVLATYLQTARGVRCSAENIIITSGAQQAITLTANLLLNEGDNVWVENPCYPGIKSALNGSLANIIPITVDKDGLDVEEGLQKSAEARLAYISPSHQYPLGVTLSLPRRLRLLQWAEDQKGWIVEDDYDSEYRYDGRPLASVQGLDKAGRVIYVGTFSKVLFPALRIGYMVVPDRIVDAFHAARAHADRGAPLLEQAVLASFIEEGHLSRHVRRMRTLYAERRAILVETAQHHLGNLLEINETKAGLHLVGWLPPGVNDQAISNKLKEYGMYAPALSSFAFTPLSRGGLVLGFAAIPTNEIQIAVKRLWGVLEEELRTK